MKPITSYELRKSPENKIVIVKLNKKGFIDFNWQPKDVTIEAIYSVIRHIEDANINNKLITYKEGENGKLIPEYELTLEKAGD
ncbi:hypothetical protein [Avibacterium paragallinarum]|uniref:Uncharacterized protein n=1 Tax=Avibacterium paragallinarum TaxID=728 RepID=A0AAE5TFN5_AVIPA|nr:hypothetical protein [Avibacterium paragallinarum]MEE3609388.1 hypothetical protein [Avibacterium paragallinarum]MEE3622202.1 hypothetical protein [Avibacterium paragallinarum]MEE3669956.1 hypothetical protein [Avibacterium paragallinarum]MEE3682068.1 hypothetical protein [Avibacterium paragallinarum]MEE4386649.1 hypothetical protein [Avibacterium paragallinarum]